MSKRMPPQARPVAGFTAVLLALVLIGAGVVGVQDLFTTRRWIDGRPWLRMAIEHANHATPGGWALPGGILAVALGVLLLMAAAKPRRSTHHPVPGTTDVWVSPGAVAALAGRAARKVPGVVTARARYTRRRVQVRVQADADMHLDNLESTVRQHVRDQLEGLCDIPVAVRSQKVTR